MQLQIGHTTKGFLTTVRGKSNFIKTFSVLHTLINVIPACQGLYSMFPFISEWITYHIKSISHMQHKWNYSHLMNLFIPLMWGVRQFKYSFPSLPLRNELPPRRNKLQSWIFHSSSDVFLRGTHYYPSLLWPSCVSALDRAHDQYQYLQWQEKSMWTLQNPFFCFLSILLIIIQIILQKFIFCKSCCNCFKRCYTHFIIIISMWLRVSVTYEVENG